MTVNKITSPPSQKEVIDKINEIIPYTDPASNSSFGVVKTDDNTITINNGVISASNIYWVSYGTTTYSDIMNAINAGKFVICKETTQDTEVIYVYRSHTSNSITFYNVSGNSITLVTVDNNDTWEEVDSLFLPSQLNNSGKFLTTDGTSASWATLPDATSSAKGVVQPDNTTITVSNGVISATDSIVIREWSNT